MDKGTLVVNGINYSGGGGSESDLLGTKAEFNQIKDDPSIPVGTAFDTTDESDEGIAVIDNLTSTSTEDALSANQGRVLKQDLNKYKDGGYLGVNQYDGSYFNGIVTSNGTVDGNAVFYTAVAKVTQGKTYTISFNQYTSVRSGVFGFSAYPSIGGSANATLVPFGTTEWKNVTVTIPSGVNYITFNILKSDAESATLSQKLADAQVEIGTEATEHSEYVPTNTNLGSDVTSLKSRVGDVERIATPSSTYLGMLTPTQTSFAISNIEQYRYIHVVLEASNQTFNFRVRMNIPIATVDPSRYETMSVDQRSDLHIFAFFVLGKSSATYGGYLSAYSTTLNSIKFYGVL